LYTTALTFLLLCIFGCSDPYQGPFIPQEEPTPFSGSVGYEIVVLKNQSVSALGGLVTLSFNSIVPDEPVDVAVATFPSNVLEIQGYLTTGRGCHINMDSRGPGVLIGYKYEEEHLKETTDHFNEEDLTIFRVASESCTPADEMIAPAGSWRLDTKNNVISTIIYGSGTFFVGVE
jgi:hypothetical protein